MQKMRKQLQTKSQNLDWLSRLHNEILHCLKYDNFVNIENKDLQSCLVAFREIWNKKQISKRLNRKGDTCVDYCCTSFHLRKKEAG